MIWQWLCTAVSVVLFLRHVGAKLLLIGIFSCSLFAVAFFSAWFHNRATAAPLPMT